MRGRRLEVIFAVKEGKNYPSALTADYNIEAM
jgi:hypothetical protein